MNFVSLNFLIFLLLAFPIFWSIHRKSILYSNIFLLILSYTFYCFWDWRFLSLILISTCIDYFVAKKIFYTKKSEIKKFYLWISICTNLGILGIFKYYNFFVWELQKLLSNLIPGVWFESLEIILPVWISFYTFQTISYTIDIYRWNTKLCNNFITFATFVSFFPQLVAGPIERANHLIPQLEKKKEFKYRDGSEGLRRILWWVGKKVLIADNCAIFTEVIFANPENYSSWMLLLWLFLFTIQIYADFSWYSDIAIWTSRLFWIHLNENFKFPFFSKNSQDFWNRWHVSLSKWLKDYIYIPLWGNKNGKIKTIRNIFIVFTLWGLWHGASWNYILWWVISAGFFIPWILFQKHYSIKHPVLWNIITFSLFCLSLILFRSPDLSISWKYITGLITNNNLFWEYSYTYISEYIYAVFIGIIVFLFIEKITYIKHTYPLEELEKTIYSSSMRYMVYVFLLFLIFIFWWQEQDFIYFQF